MRILSLVPLLCVCMLTTNTASAHGINHQPWHTRHCLHNHLDAAYRYPDQLAAAAMWRRNNIHINLHLHPQTIASFNWHPSVIALLYHNNFVSVYYGSQYQRNWRFNKVHRHVHNPRKRVRVRRH